MLIFSPLNFLKLKRSDCQFFMTCCITKVGGRGLPVPPHQDPNPPPSCGGQMEPTGQSVVSSDPEDGELMQDGLEDRKYPGEVTCGSFKVKLQPKDTKKELLS